MKKIAAALAILIRLMSLLVSAVPSFAAEGHTGANTGVDGTVENVQERTGLSMAMKIQHGTETVNDAFESKPSHRRGLRGEPLEGSMIKLFWQDGYEWQGKKTESKWCMARDRPWFAKLRGKSTGVDIHWCSSGKKEQRWLIEDVVGEQGDGDGDSDNNNNVTTSTIRTAYGHVEECMTKAGGREIHLKPCDGSPAQMWERGFDATGGRFELYPAGSDREVCVTQHHHPRRSEDLRMQKCIKARRHDTSYWNVYYG